MTAFKKTIATAKAKVAAAATPYLGTDGRYHFLYVTRHIDTHEWYGGRHSTRNLHDSYQGSGNWVLAWQQIAPELLDTAAIEFFPDAKSLKLAEAKWITLDMIEADRLCKNGQEGGHGLTSASAKAMHARPGHTAAVAKKIHARLQEPEVNQRLRKGQRRGWEIYRPQRIAALKAAAARPEDRVRRSITAREVNGRPEVQEKRSRSLKAALATPEARAIKRRTANERWAREGEKARHGAKTAERHHRNRSERYGIDPSDVEAVNAAHAAHKAELNRNRGAAFRERHQGEALKTSNREKMARWRARMKAAAV